MIFLVTDFFVEMSEMCNIPYREMKRDIQNALSLLPEIQEMTHIDAHWIPYDGNMGLLVQVTIVVHPDMTVRDASKIARKARK